MKSRDLLCLTLAASGSSAKTKACRSFPGDASWPSAEEWSAFNKSIDGRLIRTVPLGHVCHDPQYDEAACESLRAVWTDPITHYESSHSIMSGYFANQSCDPFTAREQPCVVGTYVQYAVNASGADDVAKAIKFADQQNVRLVVRNTGHDYLGKSTGAGALGIWTHNMKGLAKVDWKDSVYKGPALKLGAGIMGYEAVDFARDHGLLVVSGHCPTVGIAGGHIQGGGHSPLSSRYGLAADNALEFEVVDGLGRKLIASKRENKDLFWALSGGGGGTYGIVTSVVVKAHPDNSVLFGTLQFGAAGVSEDVYDGAIDAFQTLLPAIVDAGAWPLWGFTKEGFQLAELAAPGFSEAEVDALLRPVIEYLDKHEIQYLKEYTQYKTFQEYYNVGLAMWTKNQANIIQGGGWFLPRTVATDANQRKQLTKTVKSVAAKGMVVMMLGFNVSKEVVGNIDNAVHPGWRNALISLVVGGIYNLKGTVEEGYEQVLSIDREYVSQFKALAPNAGVYLNEASPATVNWKQDFYGGRYDRLLAIKNKFDPHHMFYALTAVGSDYWEEDSEKRLCKADEGSSKKDEL